MFWSLSINRELYTTFKTTFVLHTPYHGLKISSKFSFSIYGPKFMIYRKIRARECDQHMVLRVPIYEVPETSSWSNCHVDMA